MAEPGDRTLVGRTRAGEVEAFGELVRRYQDSVFNVCFRLLGERHEAEDLAQEAFVRAYQRLASFDVERPFGPWVRRVAANLCLNHLQGRGTPGVPLEAIAEPPAPAEQVDPALAQEQAERARTLRGAIRSLPPRYRAVIELRHFQELSYAEIAQELRVPLSDVKSDLFRARKLLAGRLRDEAL
jgi:RNA polymerase sigma-70 factor (ECF subfamily)